MDLHLAGPQLMLHATWSSPSTPFWLRERHLGNLVLAGSSWLGRHKCTQRELVQEALVDCGVYGLLRAGKKCGCKTAGPAVPAFVNHFS
mmetsp:Transcript_80974/g.135434  ORF Transcript_80974/g.135434 Transcript_80974/m.135434 type:complete len:89 (-) Transcript_80974:252-518(-)